MPRSLTLLLCLCAIGLYGASLFFPAFTCQYKQSFPGYTVLAIGYMGLLGLDPRWFANICFVVLLASSLKSSCQIRPFVAAATAILALASFASAAGCEGGGGAPSMSTGLALGGRLWVGALFLICAVNLSLRQAAHMASFAETTPDNRV